MGRATGRNKNWYNVRENSSKEKKSVNLDEVEWESINDQASINLVSNQEQGCTGTIEAKVAELQKLKQFDTYEEVKNCGQYTLSARWVIIKKDEKMKARF